MNYTFPTNGFVGCAASEFDALMYGESHPSTVSYLRNQFTNYSDTLTSAGRSFMEQGRAIFEAVNSSEAIRFARDVINKYTGGTTVQRDGIYSIFEMSNFQSASLDMQRYLLANPVIRKDYHKQKCNGYSDTYIDMEPGFIGREHYDYRRVMDGMMVITEDDFKVTHYLDPLKEGDIALSHDKKDDIIYSWSNLEVLYALSGYDPTDMANSKL